MDKLENERRRDGILLTAGKTSSLNGPVSGGELEDTIWVGLPYDIENADV